MKFAVVLPWWGYALVFGSAVVLAWLAYARVPIPLTRAARGWLTALRAATLILLIAILLRPVVLVPPAAAHNSLLPVLVDVSRSMRLTDGDGPSRLDRAREMVRELQARLANEYTIELLTFGEALAPGQVDRLAATARPSSGSPGFPVSEAGIVTPSTTWGRNPWAARGEAASEAAKPRATRSARNMSPSREDGGGRNRPLSLTPSSGHGSSPAACGCACRSQRRWR